MILKKGKNIIYISIARNYAENRKLRGRLLITRSASRPRNRVFGWALPVAHVKLNATPKDCIFTGYLCGHIIVLCQ
jgi:hypothetical protein